MLSVDSKNDNDDCAAELRLIVARRQVNVAEPRLIATGSLVNLLRKVNMPAAWLKVKGDTRSVGENEDCAAELRLIVARRQVNVAEPRLIATGSLVNAAELLCCNGNDD